ncbi:hypothetical protein [Ancylobacter terrae]|uniref:hypothetical protein n=1 Tax=Ancylobacter sp. sgz301288 TaxID=3342077 RepID=UPI00385CBF87
MMRVIILVLVYMSLSLRASAAPLPSTTEFMNILMSCGMGSSVKIDGNLKGSIQDAYEKGRVEGKLNQQIMTDIIRLVPENERAKVYEIYVGCVNKRLSQIEIEENKEYRIEFVSNGMWIDNTGIGDVYASRSNIDFLVNGEEYYSMSLDEGFDGFNLYLKKGTHTLTYKTDVRARSGRRARSNCTVSFSVERNQTFAINIKFDVYDKDRDYVSKCYLNKV